MNEKKHQKLANILGLIFGTIILASIFLSIDFLYAGIQEIIFGELNPTYTAYITLAYRVIIGSSIGVFVGIILYISMAFYLSRKKYQKKQLQNNLLDKDDSINFLELQKELQYSIEMLKDLYGYLIIIVTFAVLITLLRFIWMIGKYRIYNEFFILYFLGDVPAIIISATLYLALSFVINYIVLISLQKYQQMKVISENYDTAMLKVIDTYNQLLSEEERDNQAEEKSDDIPKQE
ncbi:MAG: hypothetical protein U9O98_06705 [Asgard group archaeon]|nr:hypothetical protein [Asgard group archaeon]